MSITIETLQKHIATYREREANHIRSATACAGAIESCEQLLTELVQSQRAEKLAAASKELNGPVADGHPEPSVRIPSVNPFIAKSKKKAR